MSQHVLVNDLGDGFITFPEFQRQLREIESNQRPQKALTVKAKEEHAYSVLRKARDPSDLTNYVCSEHDVEIRHDECGWFCPVCRSRPINT